MFLLEVFLSFRKQGIYTYVYHVLEVILEFVGYFVTFMGVRTKYILEIPIYIVSSIYPMTRGENRQPLRSIFRCCHCRLEIRMHPFQVMLVVKV